METEILSEIREAEKKADEILEKANKDKEAILHEASINSSRLLVAKREELRKLQEKKILDFREKAKLLKEEKLAEGKNTAKQIKARAEKNISKAVDLIMKKFEEMI